MSETQEQSNTFADSSSTSVPTGAFFESLRRNNSKIRADRAATISEDAQLEYKRRVEDLVMEIKRMRRDQENMLDLSPTEATSLKLASDFSSTEFVTKDIELGVRIRNSEIRLEIAKNRYKLLFGESI